VASSSGGASASTAAAARMPTRGRRRGGAARPRPVLETGWSAVNNGARSSRARRAPTPTMMPANNREQNEERLSHQMTYL